MIEVIDKDSLVKMMALILGEVTYENNIYVVFSIPRDKIDTNLFVARLKKNSQGLVMNSDFQNGEKIILENLVKDWLNLVPEKDFIERGFCIIRDIDLSGEQYYSIKECYVGSVPYPKLKEIMQFYSLPNYYLMDQPLLEVRKEKKFFNSGVLGNVFFILFGIVVIVFCISIIIMTLFH